MRRTQKQTQYIRMTKDRLNPMPPAMRRLLDERDALQAQVAALTAADQAGRQLANDVEMYLGKLGLAESSGTGLYEYWRKIAALDVAGGA